MSKVLRCEVGGGLGLAGLVFSGAAAAQVAPTIPAPPPPMAQRALQLSLNGSLVSYEKQTVTLDKTEGSSVAPADQVTSTTGFGILGPGLGVGVGYVWERTLLGVRANLATASTSAPAGVESSGTGVSVLPRLEYLLSEGNARPFIAGLLGIQHSATSSEQSASVVTGGSSSSSTLKNENSATAFAIGGAFGVHGFLNRAVSLDPEFTVLYASGSGTAKSPSSTSNAEQSSRGYSVSGVSVLFTLGLSGWIDTGGMPTPPPPAELRADSTAPVVGAAPSAPGSQRSFAPVDVPLPNNRHLWLQPQREPASPSTLVRLHESSDSAELAKCESISIATRGATIPVNVRAHGEHHVLGRTSIRGLEILATSAEADLSVCAEHWLLDQRARDGIQAFLNERRAQFGLAPVPVAAPAAEMTTEVPVAAPPVSPAPPVAPAPSEPTVAPPPQK